MKKLPKVLGKDEKNKFDPCPTCGHKLMSVVGVGYFEPGEFPYSEEKSAKEEGLEDFKFDDRINALYCEKCKRIKNIFVDY